MKDNFSNKQTQENKQRLKEQLVKLEKEIMREVAGRLGFNPADVEFGAKLKDYVLDGYCRLDYEDIFFEVKTYPITRTVLNVIRSYLRVIKEYGRTNGRKARLVFVMADISDIVPPRSISPQELPKKQKELMAEIQGRFVNEVEDDTLVTILLNKDDIKEISNLEGLPSLAD